AADLGDRHHLALARPPRVVSLTALHAAVTRADVLGRRRARIAGAPRVRRARRRRAAIAGRQLVNAEDRVTTAQERDPQRDQCTAHAATVSARPSPRPACRICNWRRRRARPPDRSPCAPRPARARAATPAPPPAR